jgi:hypothetical protein
MLPGLTEATAAEHQKDLICEATQRRLVAQVSAPLRLRMGRRLISIGTHLSGQA